LENDDVFSESGKDSSGELGDMKRKTLLVSKLKEFCAIG
jgi:hypothetical protein